MTASSIPWVHRERPGLGGGVTVRRTAMSAVAEVETAHHAASLAARDMATWSNFRISPDAALLPELDTIAARVDDLTRNNGIAAGAERTFVDNVIGPRVRCKPNPDRIALGRSAEWVAEWSQQVESLFGSYFDTDWFDAGLRYNGHVSTRLLARTIAATGEGLALPLYTKRNGSRWNTCIQLVDPARLSNPNGSADTSTLRGGVEIDAVTTAAVAYHIRKSHPGDAFSLRSAFSAGAWERIPAYQAFGRRRVIHVYESERVGQTRGKSIVAAVARQFKMLDKYAVEQVRLAVLNSLVFGALETPLDQQSIVEMMGGAGADGLDDPSAAFAAYQSAINEWRVQMRGGAIIPMPPGTNLKPFAPNNQNAASFEQFFRTVLKQVGAGLNIGYELTSKDFSQSNYSSARAALLEAWRYFLSVRQFLVDHWLDPIFDLWFEEAVQRGLIPDCTPDDYYPNQRAWTRCNWTFAGRGWVDPLKEALAAKARMDGNISTMADECAEQGRDWREQLEQMARENALADELGLPRPHVANPRIAAAEIAADTKLAVAGND
ncbi:phage portal protein [Methylobacterium durans]|uniref:Phage portal protein n=1 Tax=Methylobacterium durans TaxID=2202825 RepID=A0A2U8WAV1_9HYPH|nr:phage portal protein [Methylobacterium durans]AWN43159.1 phage portal protein [Methylobacterium durans]